MRIKQVSLTIVGITTLFTNSQVLAASTSTDTQVSFRKTTDDALEVVHVPDFNFGEYTYGNGNLANEQSKTPYIKVKDSSGTYNGWNLTVKSNGFYIDNKLNTEFRLTFKKPNIIPDKNNAATEGPTFNGEKIQISDTPTEVLNASANQGIGHWLANFYDENDTNKIQLYIPDSAAAGSYSANLIWELNAGPNT